MSRSSGEAGTGALLWLVTTKWRAAVDRAVAPLGLTHAQYVVLASLYGLSRQGTRPSQRELADFAGLEAIYVSKLARALEKTGLLVRAEHPADPRAVRLTLTDHGTAVAQRAVVIVHALQEEVTAPIGGTASPRARELVRTLRTLLGTPPAGGTDDEGNTTMTQAPALLTGQDIGEAQGAVGALLDAVLAAGGHTSEQFIVLRVLSVRGPWASPAALHEFLAGQRQLGLDPPAVAALLGGLEAAGLVRGSSPDGAGPVELTGEGADLFARLAGTVAPATRSLYAGIDPDDLATAHRVLAQVVERAGHLRATL
ncbi:MarR family winged helix-turn-helix transcriptional regulator [Sphaerisporangium corydalis]|uniref:MarR family winged helix-turn-helix transcriptional regulator n=1 Tax=Sphaerisporangium corydalis TaxID=1441875 RepID=A0ABV9ESG0_9ACTN|nr:MarR family transcriptional regulator [Sphaerisporangium corydalis]